MVDGSPGRGIKTNVTADSKTWRRGSCRSVAVAVTSSVLYVLQFAGRKPRLSKQQWDSNRREDLLAITALR